MTDDAQEQLLLPGLEPPARAETSLELAARRTIAALSAEGLLEERHALTCQLVLELAGATAAGRASKRASAAAMAAAQLLAAIDRLPAPPEGGGDGGAWDQLVAEFRRAAGSGTPARDSSES